MIRLYVLRGLSCFSDRCEAMIVQRQGVCPAQREIFGISKRSQWIFLIFLATQVIDLGLNTAYDCTSARVSAPRSGKFLGFPNPRKGFSY